MIIMGVHGRTGLDRMIFGSVANKVVRAPPARYSPSIPNPVYRI